MKKKIDEHSSFREGMGNVEYAVMTINTDISSLSEGTIENRSEAVIDDGEYIRSHWQKRIIKHQPPIIRTMEDLKLLDKDKK